MTDQDEPSEFSFNSADFQDDEEEGEYDDGNVEDEDDDEEEEDSSGRGKQVKKDKSISKHKNSLKKRRALKRTRASQQAAIASNSHSSGSIQKAKLTYQRKYQKFEQKSKMIKMNSDSIFALMNLQYKFDIREKQQLSSQSQSNFEKSSKFAGFSSEQQQKFPEQDDQFPVKHNSLPSISSSCDDFKKKHQKKQDILIPRLKYEHFAKESIFNNEQQNSFAEIMKFIHAETISPSDPIGCEFISLSILNFLSKFLTKYEITREAYQFQSSIKLIKERTPTKLRFMNLPLYEFLQVVLADLSLILYSEQTLQLIYKYFSIIKELISKIALPKKPVIFSEVSLKIADENKQLRFPLPFSIDRQSVEQAGIEVNDPYNLAEISCIFVLYWKSLDFSLNYHGFYIQLDPIM